MSLQKVYASLLEQLGLLYGVFINPEHLYIHETFEGSIPLFKVLYGKEAKEEYIIVCFHLDLPPTLAVEWFLRLRNLYPDLKVSASYFKDDNNKSFLGSKAEDLRTRKRTRDILKEWYGNPKDQEALAKQEILGEPKISYNHMSLQDAEVLYNQMTHETKTQKH